MDEKEQNQESESDANQEESNGVEQAETAAAAVASNRHQLADILKLDIDCFGELFDYSPIKDLIAIGQTCKRLQQVAGYSFQQNYADIEKKSGENGIYVFYDEMVDVFIPFINRIRLDTTVGLEMFRKKQSKFLRLKRITFSEQYIPITEIAGIEDKLKQIEFLRLFGCEVEGDLYYSCLVFCSNLKRLSITENTWRFEAEATNQWLLKKYPLLENFELEPSVNRHLNELHTFFELNPTVQMFSTSAYLLWMNRAALIGVALDDLAILVDFIDGNKFADFCNFLNELHEQGVYRHLHLYFACPLADQEVIDKTAKLNALFKLYIGFTDNEQRTLPILHDLEEICIDRTSDIINLEDVASKCPNLKRVFLNHTNSTDLSLFLNQTLNLKKIKVDILYSGRHFDHNENIIDLVAFNAERQRLGEPEQVTLYVKEHIYLATKWAMKNTELNNIIMKRGESYEWNNSFFYSL